MVTKRVSRREAAANFDALVGTLERTKEPVMVEDEGRDVVALVSPEVLARWEQGNAVSPMPTPEELKRRQSLVASILEARKQAVITPLTTADLVHKVREQERRSYGAR